MEYKKCQAQLYQCFELYVRKPDIFLKSLKNYDKLLTSSKVEERNNDIE